MTTETINFGAVINPDLGPRLTETDKGLPGYDTEVTFDTFDKTALKITMRAGRATAHTRLASVRASMLSEFGCSYNGMFTHTDKTNNKPRFFASNIAVFMHAVCSAIFDVADGSEVAVDFTLERGAGAFSMPVKVAMTDFMPPAFAPDNKLAVLDLLATAVDEHVEPGEEEAEPEEMDWQPRAEASQTMGDVRSSVAGEALTEAAAPCIDPASVAQYDDHSSMVDAELYMDTSSSEKYGSLAATICSLMGPNYREKEVLILGGHPGQLGRALAVMGIASTEVDPENVTTVLQEHGLGTRTLYNGTFEPGKTEALWGRRKFDVVVADTTTDKDTAAQTTERNLRFARSIDATFRIIQTRDMPIFEGCGWGLRVEGFSKQGCEQYILLAPDKDEDRGEVFKDTSKFAWFYARFTPDGRSTAAQPLHSLVELRMYTAYFSAEDNTGFFLLNSDDWFHFVATRCWLVVAWKSGRLVQRAVGSVKDPLELLAATAIVRKELTGGERRRLGRTFNPGRVVQTPGISKGLLGRCAMTKSAVVARYRRLVDLCVPTRGKAPPDLVAFFDRPEKGILLHRLSEVRAIAGEDLEMAKYERVLPYEALACLASRVIYKLVLYYMLVQRANIGKPMHTWEVQHLLWALTAFGSTEDKHRYLLMLLEEAAVAVRMGRAAALLGQAGRQPLEFLAGKLREVDNDGEYKQLDNVWARVADGIPDKGHTRQKRSVEIPYRLQKKRRW